MNYLKIVSLTLCLVLFFSVSADAAQCQAITKKGTQCKREAQANSIYCWQHVKILQEKGSSSGQPTHKVSPSAQPGERTPKTAVGSDSGEEHSAWGYPLPYKQFLERIGYVASHDPNWKIPHWVSYHLTEYYVNAEKLVERKFMPDPDLPPGKRAELSDYKNSGYDRGHLARQADMRGRNRQCELEACYLSNIAPQKPSFNQKIWLYLEDKVQEWARKYGEVWVITGPIFMGGQVTETMGVNRVAVPTHFYKLVVRNNGDTPKVLAFVIHQDTPLNPETKRLTPFLMSVDSVEELTGLDFLHELPDNIEDAIEAVVPVEMWNN